MTPIQFIEDLYKSKGLKVECSEASLGLTDSILGGLALEGCIVIQSQERARDLLDCGFKVISHAVDYLKFRELGSDNVSNMPTGEVTIYFLGGDDETTANFILCFANQFSKEV